MSQAEVLDMPEATVTLAGGDLPVDLIRNHSGDVRVRIGRSETGVVHVDLAMLPHLVVVLTRLDEHTPKIHAGDLLKDPLWPSGHCGQYVVLCDTGVDGKPGPKRCEGIITGWHLDDADETRAKLWIEFTDGAAYILDETVTALVMDPALAPVFVP